jgi:hypothetical protein
MMRPPMNNINRPVRFGWLQRLDRLIGDFNILLAILVLCLVVLDATVLATLIVSDEILDRRVIGMTSANHGAADEGFRGFTESP